MINDFSNFSSEEYLNEYYTYLGPENKGLLKFLHRTYKRIKPFNTLLEVGGGPVIYTLFNVIEKVDNIIFSEFSKSNRNEVIKFLKNDNTAFDWDPFIKYHLKLKKDKVTKIKIKDIKTRIREKVSAVIPIDIRKKNPFYPSWFKPFKVVHMFSVVETISESEKEFQNNLRNVINLVEKQGHFIGFFSKNCKEWTNGPRTYRNFPVDEKYITDVFMKNKLKLIKLTEPIGADYDQKYEGIFCFHAVKE